MIKTTLILSFFFLFLCINIKDRTIFSYIYDVVSPATKYAQKSTESLFSSSLTQTQTFSKKLFDNSVPRVKDSVEVTLSSRKKAAVQAPAERITEKDRAELDDLIKNHH